MTNPKGRAQRIPPFPPDREIRTALVRSGMRPLVAERAMSRALRLFRWDFCGRRKRRLYEVAAMRIGLAQLKEKVMAVATRYRADSGDPLSVDDLSTGRYASLLIDFGHMDLERAIGELVREDLLREGRRGTTRVLEVTGKRSTDSLTELRQVLDQMKLHLGVRYAEEYNLERTYRV